MNDCQKYQEMISRLIDSDLSDSEKVILATHLRSCDECKSLYRVFLAVSNEMPDNNLPHPIGLTENVMAAIRRDVIKRRSVNTAKRVLAVAACLVLMFAAGYKLLPGLNHAATQVIHSSSDVAECAVQDTIPVPEPMIEEESPAEFKESTAEMAELPKMSLFSASAATGVYSDGADAAKSDSAFTNGANSRNDSSDESAFYISVEAYQTVLSASAPCDPPYEIDRRIFINSDIGSLELLFCGENVYAFFDGNWYSISYSADEVISIFS